MPLEEQVMRPDLSEVNQHTLKRTQFLLKQFYFRNRRKLTPKGILNNTNLSDIQKRQQFNLSYLLKKYIRTSTLTTQLYFQFWTEPKKILFKKSKFAQKIITFYLLIELILTFTDSLP